MDLKPDVIYEAFKENYVDIRTPIELENYRETVNGSDDVDVQAEIKYYGQEVVINGHGTALLMLSAMPWKNTLILLWKL